MTIGCARPALCALALLLGFAFTPCSPVRADKASRSTPTVRAVQQVAPAVVNITTKSRTRVSLFQFGDPNLDRFFEDFFQPQEREVANLGTGVILDGAQGLIVTNSHVVHRANQIMVHMESGHEYRAQVIGADPDSDLAVLRIKPREKLPQVRLGVSSDLMIGESVIAIGNPFGLSHTVTRGVISALRRKVRAGKDRWLPDLIQTDASINPGNSGGPLLNADGEVIGINTAIYRHAQGIGFAIPIDRVKRVVNDLAHFGEVIPSWLGLELQDLSPRLARHFGLKRVEGVLVVGVMANSPASVADFKRGEIILAINGNQLSDTSAYGAQLAAAPADGIMVLTVRSRHGVKRRSVRARAFPLERAMELSWLKLGFTVSPLDQASARYHRAPPKSGVVIAKLRQGSKAQKIGLRPGDLVRQVGEKAVTGIESYKYQIAKRRLLSRITFLIQRGRARQFITLGR